MFVGNEWKRDITCVLDARGMERFPYECTVHVRRISRFRSSYNRELSASIQQSVATDAGSSLDIGICRYEVLQNAKY